MAKPRIKGAAIRAMLDWHRTTYGLDAHRALFRALPLEDQQALGGDGDEILMTTWLDVRVAHRLLEAALADVPPRERPAVARRAALASLEVWRRGVYKFVAQQVVTPTFYARHIGRLFRLLHDTGDRRIEIVGPGEAISETADWQGHHPLLCLFVDETMAAVFTTLGCRDVTIQRLTCVSDGAPSCRARMRWRP